MTDKKGENNELMRLDIEKVKKEAKEIDLWVKTGVTTGLAQKYKMFHDNFPILFKNIIEKKLSIEEVVVLLDTFDRAQDHFIQNCAK